MKNSDYILYLDMDGVLVDYATGWWAIAKALGIEPAKGVEYEKNDIARIHRQTIQPQFWESLGWEHGGKRVWEASKMIFENIHILTSTATKTNVYEHKLIESGKLMWIEQHLHGLDMNNVHVVSDGLLKAKFANPISILVDDRKSTVKAFVKAGGYGILHRANKYQETVDELTDLASPLNLGEIAKRIPVIRRQFWNRH